MKKLWKGKRILAMLLSLAMLVNALPVSAPAENLQPESDSLAGSQKKSALEEALGADESVTYCEVSFALPEGITEEEAAEITLPDTVLKPEGTLICTLPEPARAEYLFNGWYYDAALTEPADDEDEITRHLTLYPGFVPLSQYEDQFRINYISDQDVEPDFEIMIVSYGLPEEEIRENLNVKNMSRVEGICEFTLTPCKGPAPDLETLIPDDDELRAQVRQMILDHEAGMLAGTLSENLIGLPIDASVFITLAEYYDRESLTAELPGLDKWLEELTEEELEQIPEELLEDLRGQEAGPEQTETETEEIEAGQADAQETDEPVPAGKTQADFQVFLADLKVLYEIEDDDELLNYMRGELGIPVETLDDLAVMNGFEPAGPDREPAYYIVRPAGGSWSRGDMHQVQIKDTEYLRFVRDEKEVSQYVVYYNITVHQDDFNNMRLNSSLVFLPSAEVEGVDLGGGLFRVDNRSDGEMILENNDAAGIMTYTGIESIGPGCTVAVYDGQLKEDGTVDGTVGYFKITEALGSGRYSYGSPDYRDVIFLPDIIPVLDDGSFDDGMILLTKDQLNFTGDVYETIGLNEYTIVDKGDFLVVYQGELTDPDNVSLIGYGCITEVSEAGSGLQVRYETVGLQTLQQSADMYMHQDNVPIPLTEEDMDEISRAIEQDVVDGGVMDETADYVLGLVTGEEADIPESLRQVTFQREDGSEISLEEVRGLAKVGNVAVQLPKTSTPNPASKVQVDGPEGSIMIGLSLQHFDGTGIRGEAAFEVSVSIKLNGSNVLKITAVAMFEVEVTVGLGVKFEAEWRFAWVIPYIYDISGHVGVQYGVYIGLGLTVTVGTEVNETDGVTPKSILGTAEDDLRQDQMGMISENQEKAFADLGKAGTKIKDLAEAAKGGSDGLHLSSIPGAVKSAKGQKSKSQTKPDAKHDEMHSSVGGSFEEKYSNFIKDSDAEYVPLVDQQIARFDLPSDPFHILALTFSINFVVSFKINILLGASVTYANAKQQSVSFTVFHPSSTVECGDLETPNFQVDFFIFGMLGLRAGFKFGLAIGMISTDIASLGVTAEVGLYIEFYGLFYVSYSWNADEGSGSNMFGAILLETGVYLDANFVAQMGKGALSKTVDLYDLKLPLITLGQEKIPLDFTVEEDDAALTIDIKKGTSAALPDELYEVKRIGLSSGEITDDNMDKAAAVNNGGKSYTAMGIPYTQMDEQYFKVEYTPAGKDWGETDGTEKKGFFYYNPVNNTVTAKPNSNTDDELWGLLTFTYYERSQGAQSYADGDKVNGLLNYGAGLGLEQYGISRTVKVHWKGEPMTAAVRVYLEKDGIGGKEAIDDQISFYERNREIYEYTKTQNGLAGEPPVFQPNALLSYFTESSTENFDGIVDSFYLIDLKEGLGTRFPGYELYFIVAPYDPEVLTAYTNQYSKALKNKADQTTLESLKRRIERYKETDGFSFADYQDELLYFMMRKPETEVRLYYVEADYVADWYFEYSNLRKRAVYTTLAAEGISFAQGTNIIENTPQAVLDRMKDPGYDYVYSYKYNENLRDKTMPILAGGTYLSVNDRTVFPCRNTLIFVQASPKAFHVTWTYDDGAVTKKTAYTSYARQPKVPARNGQEFQGYWVDEDGNRYSTSFEMPAKDLVLTPVFAGKTERTVTWQLDKGTKTETKTTKLKAGTNPLSTCPFTFDQKEKVLWYTDPSDPASVVTDEFEMPDRNITLYGKYFFNCSWVLYDTGNGKYTKLTNVTFAPVYGKVLDNLPAEVKSRNTSRDYTYSYHRIYETDLAKVKANKSKWGSVSGSTVFYPYDTTYILQRSPVTVKVTWKYDDGDVVTSNWTGRALTEPRAAVRTGYDFTYWADQNGRKYVSGSTRPPHTDLTLYPHFTEHPYQTNWVLYDTGNGQYVELTSEKTTLLGKKVLENLPGKVSSYLTDSRYTYSFYRIYETDLAKVKANRSKWGTVYGSTVFYYYDTTYILQRAPVTVNITWKYDDGDVVTKNWVGRKLTAPKEISREGYDFTGWADADGMTYNYPPYNDLTLYPQFVEHAHTWDKGTVTMQATCVKTGIRTYTCTDCGKTKKEVLPINPDNHTGETEIKDAVKATCSAEGYTGNTHCKSCGAKLADGKAIAKLPHTRAEAVQENVAAATCTKEGSYDEVVYCSVCNAELSRTGKTIEKLGHDWEDVVTDPKPIYDGEESGEEEGQLPEGEDAEEEEWRACIGWKPGTTTRTCRRCHTEETTVVKIRPYIIESESEKPDTSFTIDDEYVLRHYTTVSDVLDKINSSYSLYAFYSSTGTVDSMDSFWVDGTFSFADSADVSKALADYQEAGRLTVKLVFTPKDTETFAVVENVSLTINIYPVPKYNTYLRRGPSLKGYDERATSGSDAEPAFVEVYWLEYIADKYKWTTMKEILPEKLGMEWYYAEAFSYTAQESNASVTGTSTWAEVVPGYSTSTFSTSSDLLYVTGDTPISEVVSKLKDGTRSIICSFSFTPKNTNDYLPSTGYMNFYQKWNTSWWEHYELTWKIGKETLKTETVFKGALIEPPEADNVCYWMMNGSELTGNAVMPSSNTVITGMEHVWGDPEWHWKEDFTTATATFTCTHDGSHTRSENAAITNTTDQETGQTVYTATVYLDGTEYTDKQTVVTAEPKLLRAAKEPAKEPAPEPAGEPTPETVEGPTAEPTEEPAPELAPEPATEPAQEPPKEPAQEPAPEPTQEPTPEPAQEPTPEPTQEPALVPAKEPTPEPTKEPTQEPAKEPAPEPVQVPTPEPTKAPAPEPVKEAAPEPAKEPAPKPAKEPGPEPAKESAPEPAEEKATENDG